MQKTNQTKKSRFKEIAPIDMWVMLSSTVRYSMGRRTYMSSLAGELVLRHQEYLSTQQLNQIIDEIEKELLFQASMGKKLGDDCDDQAWRTTVAQLQEVVKKRAGWRRHY